MLLANCCRCHRAVRGEEVACPFCGRSLSPCVEASPSSLPRVSRAVAAAVALGASAVVGCNSPRTIYGGPPPRELDAASDAGVASGAGLASEAGVDAAVAVPSQRPPVPPYGVSPPLNERPPATPDSRK